MPPTKLKSRLIWEIFRKVFYKLPRIGILFHFVARILALVVSPTTIYRCIVILPFSPISHNKFEVWGRRDFFVVHAESKPTSTNPSNIPWSSTKYKGIKGEPLGLGYVIMVEKGIALSNGITLNQKGKMIMGASRLSLYQTRSGHKNILKKFGPLLLQAWSAELELKYLSGTVLILTTAHKDNYSHYIWDGLCRLALIEDEMDFYPIIYTRTEMPYQKRYLSMLGFDEKQIISADSNLPSGITADRLVIPSYHRDSGVFHPTMNNFMRRKILPYANSMLGMGERIFISRSKAVHRRILNEQELRPILAEYGFSIVYLEDLTVDEQVSVFKFAKIVVSPHGAGLANLLYCDPGTKILEIFSGLNKDEFFILSVSLGLEYSYLSGIRGDETFCNAYADIVIDQNVFKQEIRLLCQ